MPVADNMEVLAKWAVQDPTGKRAEQVMDMLLLAGRFKEHATKEQKDALRNWALAHEMAWPDECVKEMLRLTGWTL